jgi:putative PIN family toxin of toxin-antitoxin system
MSQAGPPGVVFDRMTYLQAAASTAGPAAAALRLLEAGAISLFISEAVLREVRDVLSRPRVRRKNTQLTDESVAGFLQYLSEKAFLVDSIPEQFSYPRDPKDEPYVNLALAAGARFLVTWDKDLLDLMRADLPDGKSFQERFPGLTILDPVAFLRETRQPAKE